MAEKSDEALIVNPDQGVQPAFDVENMSLDLNPDQKIRVTALFMAERFYTQTIVSDGGLYQAMVNKGVEFIPASYEKVVTIAVAFEAFIRGDLSITAEGMENFAAAIDAGLDAISNVEGGKK